VARAPAGEYSSGELKPGVKGAEVGIVTGAAASLARFYVEGLGFAEEAEYTFPRGTVHRLRRGNARCKLFEPAGGVLDRPSADSWYAYGGTSYGALLVVDAIREVERAVAAGAT
jgi:hypothetical protein